MEGRNIPHSVHDHRREIEWPVVASGLWLQLAFVGASGVAFGLAALLAGAAGTQIAAASILAGGLVAAFSVRRSLAALDRAGKSAADGVAPSPGRAPDMTPDNYAALAMASLRREPAGTLN